MVAMVELSWREVHIAGTLATSRLVSNLSGRTVYRYNMQFDDCIGADNEFMGCLGEMAMAKHRDCYWCAMEPGIIDVGGVEVRAVASGGRRLMLHPGDRDDVPFVLAVTARLTLPIVTLRGWLLGRDGKRDEWWEDPTGKNRPAFFVPNDQLRAMDELP